MNMQGPGVRTPLVEISCPTGKRETIAHTTAFYNPENPVTIYRLPDGKVVSCELSHGGIEYWYDGDYREVTRNWPLSQSQYYEW